MNAATPKRNCILFKIYIAQRPVYDVNPNLSLFYTDGTSTVIIPPDPMQNCTQSEFRCATGDQCVNARFQCDRDMDCSDGSDEDECCKYMQHKTYRMCGNMSV